MASAPARAWPTLPLGLRALGVGILALPTAWEGPVLLPISPGHALSVLDSLALVPLLGGTLWVDGGLWARRGRLRERVGARPGAGVALAFAAGLGMGLLVASASSTFFWWFLVGAAVFANALLVAVAWAR